MVRAEQADPPDQKCVEHTFLPLGDPRITRDRFGAKAFVLSKLMASEQVRVPMGFALDVQAANAANGELLNILESIADALRPHGRPMIVRSSAVVEDAGEFLFPGRFVSRRALSSIEDLYDGVLHCVSHAADPRVREYRAAHGLRPDVPLMTVLVQEQVDAAYAGACFTRAPRPFHHHRALIEFVSGEAAELLAGRVVGSLFGVDVGPASDRLSQIAGSRHDLGQVTPILRKVISESRCVERVLGEAQDIEWVASAGEIYIVQARPTRDLLPKPGRAPLQRRRRSRRPAGLLFPMAKEYGQKAATQVYFNHLDCGAANGTVIQPKISEKALHNKLRDRNIGEAGSVIRFSHRKDIGLPVVFVPSHEDLVHAYLKARPKTGYAGIISDYVYVEHAFEAYLADDHLIVEHVPGNWEPQNELLPDILIWHGDQVEFWRYKESRRASYNLPSSDGEYATLERRVEPLDAEEVKRWVEYLHQRFKEIRQELHEHLPLNVHFLRTRDSWHFLNIRPTRDLRVQKSHRTPDTRFKSKRCFLASSISDLTNWDGDSPILLTHHVDSEMRGTLAALARAARDAQAEFVLTTFGVLSHPALVVREFDLEVHPLYRRHELAFRHLTTHESGI